MLDLRIILIMSLKVIYVYLPFGVGWTDIVGLVVALLVSDPVECSRRLSTRFGQEGPSYVGVRLTASDVVSAVTLTPTLTP